MLRAFREDNCDRSKVCFTAKDFNRMKPPDRQVAVFEVNRNCNSVADGLCQFSRNELCGGVLQRTVPTCVSKAVLEGCNQNIVL
jgi:hypothetical protein